MRSPKFKIQKGDTVAVIAGRSKGERGEVVRIIKEKHRVVVASLNLVKRHQKVKAGEKGGIIEKEAPIHLSNVALLDPKDNKPTKVGIMREGDTVKRISRRSKEPIPYPKVLGKKQRKQKKK